MEFNSAYREIARDCLVNWMGMSTVEANSVCEAESIESLENGSGNRYGVGAMGSINAALGAIVVRLGMAPDHAEKFKAAIINGPDDCGVLKQVREEALVISNEENFELLALSAIHDCWVRSNANPKTIEKKKGKGQLRQYAPLELIGFNEVKSDLIFLQPILARMGMEVDIEALENEYNRRSEQFCAEHDLHSEEDIANYVASGEYLKGLEIDQKPINLLTQEKEVIAKGIVSNLKASGSPLTFGGEEYTK